MLNPRSRAILFALALASGSCGQTVAETIDDTTVTTRVKTAMLNDPAIGSLQIDVETFRGVVTLSGRVKSQTEREQVIAMARGVDGVVEVEDALQVTSLASPD